MSDALVVKVDTEGFNELTKTLEKLTYREAQEFIEDTVKKLSIELLSKTMDDTPRDTSNLAWHWTNHADPNKKVSSGPSAEEWVESHDVVRASNTYQLTIYNNCEYSVYVEEGHRTRDGHGWLEGQHMLKDNVDRLNNKLNSKVMRYLDEFLRSKFK